MRHSSRECRLADKCRTWSAAILLGTLSIAVPAGGWSDNTPPGPPGEQGKPGVGTLAPGVRIDWKNLVVEVEAAVALREGPLELLACSPRTREHESILVVPARPMHIYQAMGLIGLEPGSPVRFDENRNRWTEASGDALRLEVRYGEKGAERTVPVERWLMDVTKRRSPDPLHWVFAGSRRLSGGRFAADMDGTIVAVVDFDTALIAPASLHTSSNEHLWLVANTSAIPPLGTRCTLLLKAAKVEVINITVLANGTLRLEDKPVSAAELVRLQRSGRKTDNKAPSIVLSPAGEVSGATLHSLVELLVRAGVDRQSISLRRGDSDSKTSQTPDL